MSAILALPLLVFAVLFILGLVEITIAAVIIVVILVKKIKKKQIKKRHYIIAIILMAMSVLSILPMCATKLYIYHSSSGEVPGFESNKTVNIETDNEGIHFFEMNDRKYISLTDALIKDIEWANIDISVDSFDSIEQKTVKPPRAKINYKRGIIDRIKDAEGDLMGVVYNLFYWELSTNDYLYTFMDGIPDFLITYGADNAIFTYYVSESKFDYYFSLYSDIDNYDLKMENEDGNTVSVELDKTTIDEVTSNGERLIDFSDEKFSESVAYKKLAGEKGLDTKTSHNDDFEDSLKTLYAYNKEMGLETTVAEFYIQDDKIYQAVAVYPDDDESDILLVYIQISDKSRNNLVRVMDNL